MSGPSLMSTGLLSLFATRCLLMSCLADRKNHDLRYVMKDKETGNVFFVVVFTLHLKDDVEKDDAEAAKGTTANAGGGFQPQDDDLD